MVMIFLITILLNSIHIYADLGCMDYSKHTCTWDGYDYKKFYYTQCECPCDRYFHSFKRGRCERCGHYRAPSDIVFTHRTIPTCPSKKNNYDSTVACGPCKKGKYSVRQ